MIKVRLGLDHHNNGGKIRPPKDEYDKEYAEKYVADVAEDIVEGAESAQTTRAVEVVVTYVLITRPVHHLVTWKK